MPFFCSRKITRLALLTGFGLVLFLFENMLPRPLPWVKLGLAQTAALLALYIMGWREALMVTTARVLLGALLIGTLAGPSFWLSLGAGLAGIGVMSALYTLGGDKIGIIGISLCGAMTHNLSQLALAYWLIIQRGQIFHLLPLMILPAIFTGFLIGLCSFFLLQRLQRLTWFNL